jgi:Flp pilus assembly protein TadG
MGRERRRRGWDDGATTVEAAIIFSVLITLVFGIIQFGLAFWQWNTMMLAVQQVGRYAMINNTATAGDAETQMQNILCSASCVCPQTAGNLCVYATTATGTAPDPSTITLTATYAYSLLGIPGAFTVTSQGTFPQN